MIMLVLMLMIISTVLVGKNVSLRSGKKLMEGCILCDGGVSSDEHRPEGGNDIEMTALAAVATEQKPEIVAVGVE